MPYTGFFFKTLELLQKNKTISQATLLHIRSQDPS
jgi:hypothetical protein